jgi:hypothetical protein
LKRLVFALAVSGCATVAHVGADDPVRPPVPLMPPPIARVTTRRPTLLWTNPAGTDGARVELCSDKDCEKVVDSFDAGGHEAQLPRDLPGRSAWWRLRGRRGDRVGDQATLPRQLIADVRKTFDGHHLKVTVPEDAADQAAQLIAIADPAIESFAQLFGNPLRDQPVTVDVLTTWQGMQATFESMSRHSHEVVGATDPRNGNLSILIPRLTSPKQALPPGAGTMVQVLLHELVHSVRLNKRPNVNEEPVWIREGVADYFAELQGNPDHDEVSLWMAWRIDDFRHGRKLGRYIPLADLLLLDGKEMTESDEKAFAMVYPEAYYLVRFLDSGDRRPRFRQLLREIDGMSRALLPTRIRLRVQELFGDLHALEAQWLAALDGEKLPPWRPWFAGDVVTIPDGLTIVSRERSRMHAIRPDAPMGLGTIRFTIESRYGRQPELAWAVKSPDDFAVIAFPYDEPVRYQVHHKGKWTVLATGSPSKLVSLDPHQVELVSEPSGLTVRIDGAQVLSCKASTDRLPWGVGIFDGTATFKNIEVVPATTP